MHALEDLQSVIEIQLVGERKRAFRDWLDRYVEMLGVAYNAGPEVPAEWIEHVLADGMGKELMARPGLVERQLRTAQDGSRYLGLLATIRAEPRGEDKLIVPA